MRMKKFIEVLKNPAVTIFLWILAAACEAGIIVQAVKANKAPVIAAVIMLCIAVICLIIRYKGKE